MEQPPTDTVAEEPSKAPDAAAIPLESETLPVDIPAEDRPARPGRFAPAVARARTIYGWVKHNERTLSALSMVAGFVTDNLMFRRIDLPNTQAIFAGYLTLAASSVAALHFLESLTGRIDHAPLTFAHVKENPAVW